MHCGREDIVTVDKLHDEWSALEDERAALWALRCACIEEIRAKWTSTSNPPLELLDRSELIDERLDAVQQKIDDVIRRLRDS